MTDAFTASNGMTVERDHNNDVVIDRSIGCASVFMADGTALALREFFQHERDEGLGRWRWPLYSEYVVYSGRQPVLVLNELTGDTLRARRDDEYKENREGTIYNAAVAYFEAHPERKPWEDATYKDVWIWTTADNTQEALGWVAGDGTWDIITPKGDGIKAAERPVSALVEAGFEKFRGEVSGVKRIPEDAS